MKALLFVLTMFVLLLATVAAADLPAINGTWSGNWTPKGGVPDAVTVELRRDAAGNLMGKFLGFFGDCAPKKWPFGQIGPRAVSEKARSAISRQPSASDQHSA